MTPAHKELLQEFQDFAKAAPTAHSLMEQVAQRLHQKMTRYNWTGFYLVDPADPNYLITGKVIVVQDVSKDPRYLAGSSLVKSEIVVPIFVNEKLAAELDIESYFADTFTAPEQQFVEACASVLANYLSKAR
jgi:GAF domain-containing protein